jgi:hypothetical protein
MLLMGAMAHANKTECLIQKCGFRGPKLGLTPFEVLIGHYGIVDVGVGQMCKVLL